MPTEKVGRVTNASVKKGTGRDWDEWISLLNKVGAASWPHNEIALYLKTKYKLTPWWQQGVALGFGIAAGTKIEGQNQKGLYSVGVTRSLPLKKSKAWPILVSQAGVAVWLRPYSPMMIKPGEKFENDGVDGGGAFGEIRTMQKGDKIRLRWQENDFEKPAILQVFLHERPGDKCIIGLQMDELPNARVKEKFRAYLKQTVDQFKALTEASQPRR